MGEGVGSTKSVGVATTAGLVLLYATALGPIVAEDTSDDSVVLDAVGSAQAGTSMDTGEEEEREGLLEEELEDVEELVAVLVVTVALAAGVLGRNSFSAPAVRVTGRYL